MMDIRQMRYFIEVCKLGGISQAANSLYISQQGLSSSIRRLEAELGCDLFYRKGNSLVLTEQGQYFLENAADIVDDFDKLRNHFHTSSQNNQITLLCTYSILSKGPTSLQKLLMGSGVSPVHFLLSECYTSDVPTHLENNECNFAICYEQSWTSQYESHRLFRVEHAFLVHRSHPLAQFDDITLSQLSGVRMIFPDRKTAIWEKLTNLLRQHRIQPDIVFQTNQALQVSSLLLSDPSLVARLTLDDAQAICGSEFKVLRVRDVDLSIPAVLVHRRDIPLTSAEQSFQELVLQAV